MRSFLFVLVIFMAPIGMAHDVPPHVVGNNGDYGRNTQMGDECRSDLDCGEFERCGNGLCLRSYHEPGNDGPQPLPVTPSNPGPYQPAPYRPEPYPTEPYAGNGNQVPYLCNSTVSCRYCSDQEQQCEVVNCQGQVLTTYTQACQ